MSDHYPYKLSLCAFQSLPWVVRTAMNVAWPFADAALKENVKFDKNLVKDGDVDRAVLMKPLGGDLDVSTTLLVALALALLRQEAWCNNKRAQPCAADTKGDARRIQW